MTVLPDYNLFAIDYVEYHNRQREKCERNIIYKMWQVYTQNRKSKWYQIFGLFRKDFTKDKRWKACVLVDNGNYDKVYKNSDNFDRLDIPFEWI